MRLNEHKRRNVATYLGVKVEEPRFLTHLPVLKRALNVLEAASLTDRDIELIAVKQAQQR